MTYFSLMALTLALQAAGLAAAIQPPGGGPLISSAENLDALWQAFKTRFAKRYDTLSEEEARRQVFMRKMAVVQSHNLEAGLGLQSFQLGLNEFSDWSQDEYSRYLTGYRQPANHAPPPSETIRPSATPTEPPEPNLDDVIAVERELDEIRFPRRRFFPFSHHDSSPTQPPPGAVASLPAEVNWTAAGWVTPVKNQGRCGSCWSFSATGALEGQTFNRTRVLVSLSEQNLIDCSTANYGCNGGVTDYAFQYVQQNGGIDAEESYPYTGQQGQCRYSVASSRSQCSGWTDLPSGDELALQAAVATVGPISVAIDASSIFFQLYRSGVYTSSFCSSTKLDHAVLVVGYGSYKGTPYWLVKNSWGAGWGQNGYVMMARNQGNMCGIATSASYPRY